jgi:hypothetical protein
VSCEVGLVPNLAELITNTNCASCCTAKDHKRDKTQPPTRQRTQSCQTGVSHQTTPLAALLNTKPYYLVPLSPPTPSLTDASDDETTKAPKVAQAATGTSTAPAIAPTPAPMVYKSRRFEGEDEEEEGDVSRGVGESGRRRDAIP